MLGMRVGFRGCLLILGRHKTRDENPSRHEWPHPHPHPIPWPSPLPIPSRRHSVASAVRLSACCRHRSLLGTSCRRRRRHRRKWRRPLRRRQLRSIYSLRPWLLFVAHKTWLSSVSSTHVFLLHTWADEGSRKMAQGRGIDGVVLGRWSTAPSSFLLCIPVVPTLILGKRPEQRRLCELATAEGWEERPPLPSPGGALAGALPGGAPSPST